MKDQVNLFDVLGEQPENTTIKEDVSPKSGESKDPKIGKPDKEKPADKTRVVCYCGKQHVYEDRGLSLEDIRKDLQKRYYPELTKERTEMDYDEKKGLIFPRVKAAKKGRKHFLDMAGNQAAVVNILVARDGLYEVRKTEIGVFSARTSYVHDLDPWQEGFKPFLPPIPFDLLCQAVTFMKNQKTECMVQFFWDRQVGEYFIHCPEQRVSAYTVDAGRDGPEREHLLVLDLHSHASGKACFSSDDNKDEQETRLYGVVGRIGQFFPQIRVRISVGGNHHEIDPALIFESPWKGFPRKWLEKVSIQELEGCRHGED